MISDALMSWARSHPEVKNRLRHLLHGIGFDTTDWLRIVMYRECFGFIRSLGPERLDVLEISGGPQWVREFNFRSYVDANYPEFDICRETFPRRFDLIIADQVFEHLKSPYRAACNVLEMLKPDGHFLITVPFLVKVHKSPLDCTRWTEEGLSYFLQECGFSEAGITTDSWGNRACLKANLKSWCKRPLFGSLINEPDFPVVVWAFARKLQRTHDDDLPRGTSSEASLALE